MEVQDVLNDHPDLLVGHLQPSYFRTAKDQPVQKFGDYTFNNEVDLLQRFQGQTSCSVNGHYELVYQGTIL
jgi:hypothetical protein